MQSLVGRWERVYKLVLVLHRLWEHLGFTKHIVQLQEESDVGMINGLEPYCPSQLLSM